MKGYYKLPIINYRIAMYEGTSNRRLASQAHAILPMPAEMVPGGCKKQFKKLKQLIDDELDKLPNGTWPARLGNMRNRTAVNYIKLLIEIEDKTN